MYLNQTFFTSLYQQFPQKHNLTNQVTKQECYHLDVICNQLLAKVFYLVPPENPQGMISDIACKNNHI
jgi:hypothetical protein